MSLSELQAGDVMSLAGVPDPPANHSLREVNPEVRGSECCEAWQQGPSYSDGDHMPAGGLLYGQVGDGGGLISAVHEQCYSPGSAHDRLMYVSAHTEITA
ncbi:Hypothetical predicted protein [Pelobates cultripes]|uniref:Uncharacterized protein n=1 Tax=Pelobates cultripes TaxID=61616 RepID=A0AAD1VP33_PELCU|nr:Hypothetical predicted protein [Pelobates cultripes]